MAKLPKNPAEAVAELGVKQSSRVLAFGPANGWVEALADAVGAGGAVVVSDPPPEAEPRDNVQVVDKPDEGGQTVLVWVGPVPAHTIREYPAHVSEDGVLWVVLPRPEAKKQGQAIPPAHEEAEVKRALLVGGWRDDRVLPLSTDAYAIRFRRRK
jgi:hypothetical protein